MSDTATSRQVETADPSHAGVRAGQGVHQLGYRPWSGSLVFGWTRWMVISQVGILRAWQSQWLKRMLFFAWLPALWFGAGFFVWEQAAQYPDWLPMVAPLTRALPSTPVFDEVKEAVRTGNLADSRHVVWSWLLQTFFRNSQAVLMVLLVGLIAPPLISQDIRSRAFLLYFSRPLTRSEYLFGKLGTLWAYLAMVSAIPALGLYIIGVMLSPRLNVVIATCDLPLRIFAASIVLILPTSALALCLSSLTQESRYAGFSWFAIWILGWFTYVALSTAETFHAQTKAMQQGGDVQQQPRPRQNRGLFRGPPRPRNSESVQLPESVWTHLSLYHTLGRVQSWVFGFSQLSDVFPSIAILVGITLVSLNVLLYRISAPMRI